MRLRYRPFQAAVIAALAALVTACAAFAPLYDRAMREALTDIGVERADPATVGLQLTGTPSDSGGFGIGTDDRPPPPEAVAARLPASARSSYGDPVLGYTATATTAAPAGGDGLRGPLVWRDGQCDHLTVTHGACPASAGEVAISADDARVLDLWVGARLEMVAQPTATATPRPRSVALVVSGIYEQRRGAYWFGLDLTGRAGLVDPGPPRATQHDVWLTPRETFEDSPPLPGRASTAQLPLHAEAVDVEQLLALQTTIERLREQGRQGAGGSFLDVVSGLPDIAQDVRDQTDQSRVTVPLLMAQLGVLAVVVLRLVLLAVTEQRRPEVALARLRGRGRTGARRLLLGELLPVALAGVVPGVLLALAGSWVARRFALPGHASLELGLPVVVAVALALAVLAGVTVLAVLRVSREPVETLLRRVPPRRAGWAIGVGDALVVAGAGGVVLVFATGGLDGPAALAAPGLIAVVVGLLLGHATTPVAASVGHRLVGRGRLRSGVSFVDAARSPATRRVVAIVTLAAALVVFAGDALVVGERNRSSAAQQEAGARMVADVDGHDLEGVRAALAEVDPDGRSVTPVVSVRPPGADTTGTLAVVPDQFRRIALFPGGAPPAGAWDRLRLPQSQPIRVAGDTLRVDVDDSDLVSRRVDGGSSPVSLGVDLVTSIGEVLHIELGELPGPTDHRRFEVLSHCTEGCYLTGVWVGTLPGATITGSATLRDVTGDRRVGVGPATQWTPVRSRTTGTFTATSSDPAELTIAVHSQGTTQLTLPQTWLPAVVPALVAGDLPAAADGNDFGLAGLDGEQRPAAEVARLARVPASGPDTALVNLDLVARGSVVGTTADVQLWFAEDDPALLQRVRSALERHGVTVSRTTTLGDVRQVLDQSAAAWSLQLAAVVGVAALLIALLVLAVSAASTWRLRTRDLAALRMSGVPRRTVAAMSVAAQLPAVVVGVVAGTAAGLYGAHLALPIVPLLAHEPEVSTVDLGTAWPAVAAAVAVTLVVLGLAAVALGRAQAGGSHVRRLRETL